MGFVVGKNEFMFGMFDGQHRTGSRLHQPFRFAAKEHMRKTRAAVGG